MHDGCLAWRMIAAHIQYWRCSAHDSARLTAATTQPRRTTDVVFHIAKLAALVANDAARHAFRRGCVRGRGDLLVIKEFAQTADAGAGKDAEDVALVVVKLRRGLAAESEQFLAKESLDAR